MWDDCVTSYGCEKANTLENVLSVEKGSVVAMAESVSETSEILAR